MQVNGAATAGAPWPARPVAPPDYAGNTPQPTAPVEPARAEDPRDMVIIPAKAWDEGKIKLYLSQKDLLAMVSRPEGEPRAEQAAQAGATAEPAAKAAQASDPSPDDLVAERAARAARAVTTGRPYQPPAPVATMHTQAVVKRADTGGETVSPPGNRVDAPRARAPGSKE